MHEMDFVRGRQLFEVLDVHRNQIPWRETPAEERPAQH